MQKCNKSIFCKIIEFEFVLSFSVSCVRKHFTKLHFLKIINQFQKISLTFHVLVFLSLEVKRRKQKTFMVKLLMVNEILLHISVGFIHLDDVYLQLWSRKVSNKSFRQTFFVGFKKICLTSQKYFFLHATSMIRDLLIFFSLLSLETPDTLFFKKVRDYSNKSRGCLK